MHGDNGFKHEVLWKMRFSVWKNGENEKKEKISNLA